MVSQYSITLTSMSRGYHLITRQVQNGLDSLPQTGLLHIFVQHTSAGITINENADHSVRDDFETFINHLIPENHPLYSHVYEGSDDMPAHLKASLIGSSVTIPISGGQLNLGIWQGIYLCEFRDHGGPRRLVLSVYS